MLFKRCYHKLLQLDPVNGTWSAFNCVVYTLKNSTDWNVTQSTTLFKNSAICVLTWWRYRRNRPQWWQHRVSSGESTDWWTNIEAAFEILHWIERYHIGKEGLSQVTGIHVPYNTALYFYLGNGRPKCNYNKQRTTMGNKSYSDYRLVPMSFSDL